MSTILPQHTLAPLGPCGPGGPTSPCGVETEIFKVCYKLRVVRRTDRLSWKARCTMSAWGTCCTLWRKEECISNSETPHSSDMYWLPYAWTLLTRFTFLASMSLGGGSWVHHRQVVQKDLNMCLLVDLHDQEGQHHHSFQVSHHFLGDLAHQGCHLDPNQEDRRE